MTKSLTFSTIKKKSRYLCSIATRRTRTQDASPQMLSQLRHKKSTHENIPKNITPDVTEQTLHRDYCPNCKKIVEPIVADAMPKGSIGNAWCNHAQ